MQINPDFNSSAFTIRSYRAHEIDVFKPIKIEELQALEEKSNEPVKTYVTLNKSFVVTPEKLIENWSLENPHILEERHFQELASLKPEIILIGTGKRMHFSDPLLTLPLQQAGIGVEFMDTAAACRTYNYLVSDSRKVAAAIFMIED